MQEFEIITRELCLKSDLGVNDNAFGGAVLAWIDKATAIFIMEKTHTSNVVTVNTDFTFGKPIKEARIVHISCRLAEMGNSSVKVEIKVETFAPDTGKYRESGRGFFTFVRIDQEGDPRAFPPRIKKLYPDIIKKKDEKNK